MSAKRLIGMVTGALALSGALVAVPAVASAAPATVPGTPCTAAAKACLDLTTQKAWLIKDGRAWYGRALAASGKNNSTHPGNYRVTWKDIDHRSSQFHGAPMNFSVFFDHHGRAFHEGNVWKKSNGCVHLTRHSAKVFFNYLHVGDRVQIRGHAR
ncbi:L,D-transpeptidase [Sciscionella sediminilitoris]|uniref:L,D-transpeptidase n=1 Tax=Sciscionella sediminilitoris TaxID=1445613 RepID=UPI0004DF10FB|nr:L,D-transpeptidase [Sciscionella sp. SE31]